MANILMTVTKPLAYGAVRMAAHYAAALHAAGHTVLFAYGPLLPDEADAPTVLGDMAELGIETVPVPNMGAVLKPSVRQNLAALVRSRQADLIVASQLRDTVVGMAVAAKTGVPGIVNAQNMPRFTGPLFLPALKKHIYRTAVRDHATKITCSADGVRNELIADFGCDPAKLAVVPNGLDVARLPQIDREQARQAVREEFGLPADALLLVNLARLHEQKGQDMLLQAVERLKDAGSPAFTLLLVGGAESPVDMAFKRTLEEYSAAHGLDATVRFTGFRKDGYRLLRAADLFVLPSRWEGLPLAVLESFAAECPVVMMQYGERFAGFADGQDGIYVPVGDVPAFATAVQRVLAATPQMRLTMGRRGRDYVLANLTLDAGKQRFLEEVEGVLNQSSPAAASAVQSR